jgi:hypothetical protein
MIFLMSVCTSARHAPYRILMTASVMIAGVKYHAAAGNSGMPSFMKP